MAYTLSTSYMGDSLLNGFDFLNGTDLSNGFVSYQGYDDAEAQGLFSINEDSGVVRLGVDSSNTYQLDEGRPSLRLESKESWTHGLFIADFLHMPPSQCGLWPAFWAYGNEWPSGGELDIIEGANTAHNNIISAHTAPGCFQDSTSQADLFSGEQRNEDCYVGDQNIGCGYNPPSTDASSYGDGFNAVGGGVYAMEWDSEYIKVWHFARGDIPSDIGEKAPNPDAWGMPQAVFGSARCDVDEYFKDMSLVININFCGDYGNALWGTADSCTDFAPTCQEYVANNPEAFANAYWDVAYIDAYTFDPNATPSPTPTPTPVITTTPTPAATQTPVNPATIENFSYLGCFSSSSDFKTFQPVQDSDVMTLEMCIESCSEETYAGLSGNSCSCASDLDADTMALPFESSDCSTPCPGDSSQFCGGEERFTVYANVAEEEHPQPPPMAGRPQERFVAGTTTVCPPGMALPTGAPLNGTGLIPEAGAVERRGPGKGVVVWAVVVGLIMVL